MNAWHFFAYLYQHFDQTFLGWVQQTITSLATAMRAPIIASVTLYIAGLAAIELFEPSGNPMSFLIRKVIRGAIVILAITAANYSDLFGTFVLTTLPNEITAAISGAAGGNATLAPDAFDKMLGQMWVAANEAYKNVSGWSAKSFGLVICIILFAVFSALAIGAGFLLFMAQHVLLGLCIAIGPLLIGTLLWPKTARFFDGWIGAVVTLILSEVLIVALLSMTVVVDGEPLRQIAAMNGANGINASDELGQIHFLIEGLILSASIGYYARLVTHVAMRIAGGIAAEVSPATRMISSAVSNTVGIAGKAVSGATGAAISAGAAGMRSLKPAGKAP
ncbi:MAG: type IV secretion system protein [Rhodopila sp.]